MSNEAFEKWLENIVLNDINDLREALKHLAEGNVPEYDIANYKKLLATTPAQSLQEHDNEVIEKCAKVCESSDRHRGEYFATKIRALKGLIK